MKPLWLAATLFLSACSGRLQQHPADELFRLRAECANQARLFEKDWRAELGPDYGFSVFRNHYNERDGRCYVDILSENEFGNHETVMDATEGIGSRELAWRKVLRSPVKPDQRNPNSENDEAKALAKIGALMGDAPGSAVDQLVQKYGGK